MPDIAELAETLRLKLAPFRRTQLKSATRMEKSSAEHQDIVEAIVDNDPSGAAPGVTPPPDECGARGA